MNNINNLKITFFGGEPLSVPTLEILKKNGIIPDRIVCNPDTKQGRKMILTPPPTKLWAKENTIPVFQPESLRDSTVRHQMSDSCWDLFIVVAYGKIIPKEILDIPQYGVVNLHPSLLPKFRGASPIRSAILEDQRETGVTIMKMDEEMDHGPILAREKIEIRAKDWPMKGTQLDTALAEAGARLLVKTIPKYVRGKIEPKKQNHSEASYTKKIIKADGEIDLKDDPYQNLLKIRAYDSWPGTFFFMGKEGSQIRIKITDAELSANGSLNILKVIPEGKGEIPFSDLQIF